MKKVLLCTMALTAMLGAMAQTGKVPAKTPAPAIKTLIDSFSYAAGYNVASNMKEQGITEVNAELMKKGIDDYFKKKTPALAPEIGNGSLQRQLDIFAKAKAAAEKLKTDSVLAAGVAFLENNKKKPGIIILPDGLQYEILKRGDSAAHRPTAEDTVIVNYIGTLMDGKEFQSSYTAGKPAIFRVSEVIKAWNEILQMMPVGSLWKVYIPTELGYADNPPPGSGIPKGAPLIFQISLEGIKPAATKPAQ